MHFMYIKSTRPAVIAVDTSRIRMKGRSINRYAAKQTNIDNILSAVPNTRTMTTYSLT